MNTLLRTTAISVIIALLSLSACSLNDTLLLQATSRSATGGTKSQIGTAGSSQMPATRLSPFCKFMWGRQWQDANPLTPYANNLGMTSLWIGYETNDGVNDIIRRMLVGISPGGVVELQGAVPVFYAYFIPFKARNSVPSLGACDPSSTSGNICTKGAQWIRDHRDYLRSVYDSYAKTVATIWGTTRPIVWFVEPGFNDYILASQENPLSLQELSIVASDLIATIKARLPNALISHFASPLVTDFGEYFGAFDLSQVNMVNVTGVANSEYFKEEFRDTHPNATYRNLHDATGLPIIVDTGFDASLVANHGWLTADPGVINQRIAEGVIGVQLEPPIDSMQSRIATVNPQLTPLDCAP